MGVEKSWLARYLFRILGGKNGGTNLKRFKRCGAHFGLELKEGFEGAGWIKTCLRTVPRCPKQLWFIRGVAQDG